VTLKIMRAEVLSNPLGEIPEVAIPRELLEYVPARGPCTCSSIQDYSIERGPNGSHLCLVSHLAGLSILSMLDSPGRMAGSRRLRCDLAKKIAKQIVGGVELMHTAGFVHGGP
jgi:hypothetical protein